MAQAPLGNLKARQSQDPEMGFTPAPQINEVYSFERMWLKILPTFRDYFGSEHCSKTGFAWINVHAYFTLNLSLLLLL